MVVELAAVALGLTAVLARRVPPAPHVHAHRQAQLLALVGAAPAVPVGPLLAGNALLSVPGTPAVPPSRPALASDGDPRFTSATGAGSLLPNQVCRVYTVY